MVPKLQTMTCRISKNYFMWQKPASSIRHSNRWSPILVHNCSCQSKEVIYWGTYASTQIFRVLLKRSLIKHAAMNLQSSFNKYLWCFPHQHIIWIFALDFFFSFFFPCWIYGLSVYASVANRCSSLKTKKKGIMIMV